MNKTNMRLLQLERRLEGRTYGDVVVTFMDGRTEQMFWTDAMMLAIDGEIVAVTGDDSDSNLVGLVRAMIESEASDENY